MKCLTPIYLKEQTSYVPCGRCASCFRRNISQWSFRLLQEYKHSLDARFITLTYDRGNVPLTVDGRQTVSKRHLQLFIKRVRKCLRTQETKQFQRKGVAMHLRNYQKVKYYAVAEYGSKTSRPHYHLLIYNANVRSIESAWKMGDIHFGYVSEASVGYTLKYMFKQSRIGLSKKDSRKKTFSLMSKHLGMAYLTPAMITWHKADLENRMYVNIGNRKKVSMPRYYKLKLYSNEEAERLSIIHILQQIEERYLEAAKEFGDHKIYRRKKQDILAANRRISYSATQSSL